VYESCIAPIVIGVARIIQQTTGYTYGTVNLLKYYRLQKRGGLRAVIRSRPIHACIKLRHAIFVLPSFWSRVCYSTIYRLLHGSVTSVTGLLIFQYSITNICSNCWRYVALVVVLWRPTLSSSSSSAASVTALRWEPVNVHV